MLGISNLMNIKLINEICFKRCATCPYINLYPLKVINIKSGTKNDSKIMKIKVTTAMILNISCDYFLLKCLSNIRIADVKLNECCYHSKSFLNCAYF